MKLPARILQLVAGMFLTFGLPMAGSLDATCKACVAREGGYVQCLLGCPVGQPSCAGVEGCQPHSDPGGHGHCSGGPCTIYTNNRSADITGSLANATSSHDSLLAEVILFRFGDSYVARTQCNGTIAARGYSQADATEIREYTSRLSV